MNAEQLQQRICQGIPLANHMGFRVCELDANKITVSANQEANINVHGTAFAGSLYSVCTLALWGLVTARLPSHAALVLAEGQIQYRQPVLGDIVAHCEIIEQQMDGFLSDLQAQGKVRLNATVVVPSAEGVAAQYTATVYANYRSVG